MRLLLANEQRDVVGGMETYLRWLARELCSRGHELVCVTRYPATSGETWIPEQATSVVGRSEAELVTATSGSTVALMSPLGSTALEEALTRAIPTVLFAHTFYGTCVSGAKTHAFPTRRPCGRRMSIACLGLYGPRRCGGKNPLTALRLYRKETRRAELLSSFRKVLVTSRFMAHEYARHGLGPERVQCVPLPVERPSSKPPLPYRRRVLFLGRLTAVKGLELLIKALARLSRGVGLVELDVAGDGAARPGAEELAKRLGVRARFHGWVDQSRRTALFREGGLLAVPSTWPEPFGLVGLEASAQGMPVVAFDVGGIREWLVPGVTGEIAAGDPPAVDGLADALKRALEPDHWAVLSAGAYAQSARFAPAAHADAIEACLRAQS